MNVTIEEINTCNRRLRIEVPVNEVNSEIERITAEFQKEAKIAGFRPGKAPLAMVGKRYEKEIDEEVRRTMVPKAYRQAVKEKKMRVVTSPTLEEVKFERGLSLSFAALVEIAPSFILPEYKGVSVPMFPTDLSEEEYQKFVQGFLDRQADFEEVTGRGVEKGDFAVISFTSTCEGKELTEVAPAAKNLASRKSFWLQVEEDAYLPKFGGQLMGLKPGEKKEVAVDFPEDFPHAELRGKKAVFSVDLEQIKQKKLPELNEEFAKQMTGESLEEFHKHFREALTIQKKRDAETQKKNKIIEHLLSKVDFEVPQSLHQHQTRDIIQDIVEQNYSHGITPEAIELKKDEIFQMASKNALDSVKIKFVLGRIAEEEKIEVTEEEINARITQMAQRHGMTPQKLIESLYQRNAMGALEEEILVSKTLDFLLKEAKEEAS